MEEGKKQMTATEGAVYYCGLLSDIQRWVESMTDETVDFEGLPKALQRLYETAYVMGRKAKAEELRIKLGLNE